MKKIITVVIGLFGMLMGIGLILPALAKVRDFGAMPSAVIGFYTLGILLTLIGFSIVAISLLSKRKAA